MNFSRRRFLGAAGTAALCGPFLRSRPSKAQALAPNLVLVTWPDGLEPGWQPEEHGLGSRLEALNPHRDQLLVIDGLIGGIDSELNAHSEGPPSMWTGSRPAEGLSQLPSIDHLLAERIGRDSPFPKLHFGVQSTRTGVLGNASPRYFFSAPGAPVPSEDDPQVMYERIFSAVLSTEDRSDVLRSFQRRETILSFVDDRLRNARLRVSAEDRPKLDAHLASIESIERSLARLRDLSCDSQLSRPEIGGRAAVDLDEGFETVADVQGDLLVTALSCGLTKIATLQLSQTDSALQLPGWPAALHSVMHDHPTADRIEVNLWFVAFLARLLEKLASVDLGGASLLDETIVVATSEMAIGNHGNDPIPYFVAGGGGRHFRLGRTLRLEGKPRNTRLLTSIMHAMGQTDVGSIGEFEDEASLGALEEVR
ncbi:MAG: DUF1552 domain-containing protein [Myxococcota bacterium]